MFTRLSTQLHLVSTQFRALLLLLISSCFFITPPTITLTHSHTDSDYSNNHHNHHHDHSHDHHHHDDHDTKDELHTHLYNSDSVTLTPIEVSLSFFCFPVFDAPNTYAQLLSSSTIYRSCARAPPSSPT